MTDKLQTLCEWDCKSCYLVAGGVVAVSTGLLLYKVLKKKKAPLREAPPNTAVIYQFIRGPNAPSLSPFPMKLETYCRMAKIPYITDSKGGFSSKGKIPWMTYNGEVVEDSQLCIEFFNKKLGVDLNKHLDVQQMAVATFIRVLTEEHLYWTLAYFRWIHDKDYFPKVMKSHLGMPSIIYSMARRSIRAQLHGQGMGRHTPEQIQKIAMDDLKALSDFLGSKPYMMSNEMCEADCSVFGMLSQLVWHQEDKVLANILKVPFYHDSVGPAL